MNTQFVQEMYLVDEELQYDSKYSLQREQFTKAWGLAYRKALVTLRGTNQTERDTNYLPTFHNRSVYKLLLFYPIC